MSEVQERMVRFFLSMQAAVNTSAIEALTGAFAPEFLYGDPNGSRTLPNDEVFVEAVRERMAFMHAQGFHDAKALQIDETSLSEHYSLVRVLWSVWFTPEGRSDFVEEFAVDYLVHLTDSDTEIVASIAHDDDAEFRRRCAASD